MPSKTALDMTPTMWKNYKPFKPDEIQKAMSTDAKEARKVARHIAHELVCRFKCKKVFLFVIGVTS